MAKKTKFEVGDRVRIISADPICVDASHVGKYGIITAIETALDYDYLVHLENDTAYGFVESELIKAETTSIRGVVDLYSDGTVRVGDRFIEDLFEPGDEVHVTIEVIKRKRGRK